MAAMAVALYPGTFDPFTNGHVDILKRGATLFERVIVAVGARVEKQTLLPVEERVALAKASAAGLRNVDAAPFTGLVVDFAKKQGATVLLRGIRNPMDYEYETQMAVTNRRLAPAIETVFLVAAADVSFISSTLIKEILAAGGSVDAFVPDAVAKALRARKR